MFLKSIELFGFKSFADKSSITLGDGVSVVVGPNGCGKSNIVDALRWVLGEQGAKGLRTDKMAGVIFNGTEQRHPLNVAEVSLILSNEKNVLPLEFSEIEIKRRVFRSGNSEYYINNKLVTLKELKEVLSDSGIGTNNYIVMEQGRIDGILESKPAERRSILEEAAGIVKYRIRSAESARRLTKVKENKDQLVQVLKEVQSQHKTLKEQCDKALRYRQLKEVIFDYEVRKACLQHYVLQQKGEKFEAEEKTLKKDLEKHNLQVKSLLKDNEAFLKNIKTHENQIIDNQKTLASLSVQMSGVKESIKKSGEYEKNIQLQLQTQQSHIDDLHRKKKSYIDEQKELFTTINKHKEKNNKLEKKIKELQKKIADTEKNIGVARGDIVTTTVKEEKVHKKLEDLQKSLRNVVDRLAAELEKQLSNTSFSAYEQEERAKNIFKNLESLYKNTSDNSKKFLEKTKKIIMDIKTDFKEFYNSQPFFLKDFLSNDGVLSHKHIIDKKIVEFVKERGILQKNRQTLSKNIEKYELNKQKHHTLLQATELQRHALQGQVNFHLGHIERIKTTIGDIVGQEKTQKNVMQNIITSKSKVEKDILKQTQLLEELKQRGTELEKLHKTLIEKTDEHYGEVDSSANKISLAHEKTRHIQKEISLTQQKKADMETRLLVLSEGFSERYGEVITTYTTQAEYQNIKEKDIYGEKTTQKIQKAKEELRNLGGVNLLAPDEFRQVNQRYEFLHTQFEDLEESEKNIKKVVEEIEQKSRAKLEKTYRDVRKHFKSIFVRLMDGGFADMELIDSDDILEAGLEIVAQPPQKKTKHLSQLSGGERTLVALSLLFAVHSVRPAPFCILDELDAPLDEQNIGRFIALVEDFKHLTQFMIISHNKRTIAYGKQLIGVTMEERGISKLIGVKTEI